MEKIPVNLQIFDQLQSDSKEKIEFCNSCLNKKYGARLEILGMNGNNLKVAVTNINGKKAPKAELLDFTYKSLKQALNGKYRLTIKL